MRLQTQVKPTFARHETFHPRYGWFKKAFDGVLQGSGDVFLQDDATVTLGVGKNMVRAIRFWGLASKVLHPAIDPRRPRLPGVTVTPLAEALLSEDGWDPYLEDPATLWLLHWQLFRAPSLVPVWWIAFNDFAALEFTDVDLAAFAVDVVARVPDWSVRPKATSIKKDVDCLLRMYAGRAASRQASDDALDCPFRDLGLVTVAPQAKRTYRFLIGPKPTLPSALVAFAALDFLASAEAGARTATVARLAAEPGGPARIFKLSEDALVDALEAAAGESPHLELTAPVGVPQLVFDDDPDRVAARVLSDFYTTRSDSTRRLASSEDDTAMRLLAPGGTNGRRRATRSKSGRVAGKTPPRSRPASRRRTRR